MNHSYDTDFDDDYEDYDSDDHSETVVCPSCKSDVYEDAVACPNCGEYIVQNQSPFANKPIWFLVVVCLIIGYLIFSFIIPH